MRDGDVVADAHAAERVDVALLVDGDVVADLEILPVVQIDVIHHADVLPDTLGTRFQADIAHQYRPFPAAVVATEDPLQEAARKHRHRLRPQLDKAVEPIEKLASVHGKGYGLRFKVYGLRVKG